MTTRPKISEAGHRPINQQIKIKLGACLGTLNPQNVSFANWYGYQSLKQANGQ